MSISVFDICGTLYSSNTTFDFLKWEFRNKKTYIFYSKIYHTFLWKVLNKIIKRTLGYDLTRSIAVRFLKGKTSEQLKQDVAQFYDTYLKEKKNDQAIDILFQYNNVPDNNVIVASATLDIIAEKISNELGVREWYSTKLCFVNGVCIGKYHNDLLGKKSSLFNNYDKIDIVVTDDISDIDLIKKSKKCLIVTYPKTVQRWTKVLSCIKVPYKIIKMQQNISF